MALRTVFLRDGTSETVDVPPGATKQDIVDILNARRATSRSVSSAPTSFADRRRKAEQDYLQAQQNIAQLYTAPKEESGILSNLTSGFGAGVVGTGEIASLGLASLLEEEEELAARDKIKSFFGDLTPEGGDQDSISYGLGQALGSIAGIAAPVAAVGAAPIAGAGIAAVGTGLTLAGAAGAGEASERAREEGATEEERNEATLLGTLVGFTELVPIARFVKMADLPALNKLVDKFGPETIEGLGDRVRRAVGTAGVEGGQEVAAEFFQNAIERGYNIDQDLAEGLAPAAGYGAGAGAIVQGVVDLFTRGRRIGDRPPPEVAEDVEPTLPADALPGRQGDLFEEVSGPRERPEDLTVGEYIASKEAAVSPDQLPLPGLEPEKIGPQLQGLPAPEGETIPGETLAVTPLEDALDPKPFEGQALTREEALARINQRDRERKITEQPVSDEAQLGQQRAEIATREQADLFPTELARAEQPEGANLEEAEAAERRIATESQEDVDSVIATEEVLDSLDIPLSAPIRKRLADKNLREDDQVQQLEQYAARKNTSGKAKASINRFLQRVPEEQLELVTPTGRPPRAKVAKEVAQKISEDPKLAEEFEKATQKGPAGITRFAAKFLEADTGPTDAVVKVKAAEEQARTKEDVADKRSRRLALKQQLLEENPNITPTELLQELDKSEPTFVSVTANTDIDAPLPQNIVDTIRTGNLKQALLDVADGSVDRKTKRIAKKLSEFVGNTEVDVARIDPQQRIADLDTRQAENVQRLLAKRKKGETPIGLFSPSVNRVILNEDGGLTAYTLLHETAHAATVDKIINQPNSKAVKDLDKIFTDVKAELGKSPYGLENIREFVAETFSNPDFQKELAKINTKGQPNSALQRFLRWLSDFIGISPFRFDKTAQSEVERLVEDILAPAPSFAGGPKLLSMTTKDDVAAIGRDLKREKPKLSEKAGREKIVRDFKAGFLGMQTPAGKKAGSVGLGLLPNQAVQDIAESTGIADAKKLMAAIEKQRGRLTEAEKETRQILDPMFRWADKASQKANEALDTLVYESTINEVDPALNPQQAQNKYKNQTIEGKEKTLKIEVYKKLRKIYTSQEFGEGGRKTYDNLRKFYKDRYNDLLGALRGRIDGLDIEDGAKNNLKNELLARMLENTSIEPYFPLTRSGSYWLAVRDPKGDKDKPAVFAYQTAGDRVQAMEDYANQGLKVEPWDNSDSKSYENAPSGSFIAQLFNTLNIQGVDSKTREQVARLFIEELPESSFAKALVRRKKTEGYDVGALQAARTKAYDLTRQTERIKNSAEISKTMREIDEKLAGTPAATSAVADELRNRAGFAIQPAKDEWAKRANRMAFFWTIGFNTSSALVNLSQIPLFAYPMLAGKFGFGKAGTAIKDATKLFAGTPTNRASKTLFGDDASPTSMKEAFAKSGLKNKFEAIQDSGASLMSLDNYYTFTRDSNTGDLVYSVRKDLDLPAETKAELNRLRPLMQLASRRGHLNSSFIADTLSVDSSGRELSKGDMATGASALMFHQAEMMNRQVALVASYNLALDKITNNKSQNATAEQRQQAAEEAVYETQQINGGATLETGPRFARAGALRVALMYKNYGIQMYYTMGKTAMQFLDVLRKQGVSKAVTSEAAKQLAATHLSALFFAGVQGLPLYGVVSMLYDALFAEEYEEDTDTLVRRYLDNDALFKGALSEITGLDVSERVKLTDLLVEADRFNSNPSTEETFFHLFGGPAWSIFSRMVDGAKKISDGELERGLEDMMPGAVRNAYQAVIRYPRDEGILTRRGDVIYDDITGGDIFAKLLGFPPNEYTNEQAEVSAAKGMESAARNRRADLLKKYYLAKRFGDREGAQKAARQMIEFNETRAAQIDPKLLITPETIERSMKAHERTTNVRMHNGVTLSPYFQRAVKEEGFF